jgi:uncharacterized protein (TIGR00369 family)
MTDMTCSTFEFVRDNIARTPFHQWLLPELIAVDDKENSVTIRLIIRPELGRETGRTDLHGGIVASLIDIAGHAAIAAKVRHNVATVDMRVDYLRLAGGTEITAVASIVKIGRTIGVVDIRLTDDQKRLVAIGRASYVTANI